MKILLHSYWFWPSIGGLETVSHMLATGWSELGHSVTVLTHTPAREERDVSYKVYRWTGWASVAKLVRESDIVFANGSSTHLFPSAVLYGKPFVWTHGGYALQLFENPIWTVESATSPKEARTEALKKAYYAIQVLGRKLVANLADANIAITQNMLRRQPLPRQRLIYNPIDYQPFAVHDLAEARQILLTSAHTYSFLGRLVKEKGVEDLLQALHILDRKRILEGKQRATLQIIGDGPELHNLKQIASNLGLDTQVTWLGFKTGDELAKLIRSSGIFIIPSRWEEPMGLVALELLSAGKPLIVSERGGLSECAGEACLVFPNGDVAALAQKMELLADNAELQASLASKALQQIKLFNPTEAIESYLQLFEEVLTHRKKPLS